MLDLGSATLTGTESVINTVLGLIQLGLDTFDVKIPNLVDELR